MFAPKMAVSSSGAANRVGALLPRRHFAHSSHDSGHAASGRATERAGPAWNFGDVAVSTAPAAIGAGLLQRKLAVGSVDDPLEHEADRAADAVMDTSDDDAELSAASPRLSRKCADCEDDEQTLNRKPIAGAEAASVSATAAGVPAVLASPGQKLDAPTRAFFEARFGHSFGDVRVHAGAAAAASARAVNARAYTVGSDIAFGAAQYAPHTAAGRHLLAHELAHVVQQSGGSRAATIRRQHGHARRPARPAKTCPATYRIPDDVAAAVHTAWRASGHGRATVTEHGGRIVNDAHGRRAIHTGSGGSGSISIPAERRGETTVGTFHTHPYSRSEGSSLGVSFSGGDIENFVAGGQGGVKYVGAGTCTFVLNTLDQAQRDACKPIDLKHRWDRAFGRAGGSFQHKVERAVHRTIRGCGLCYYKACRPDAGKPIPKTAALA